MNKIIIALLTLFLLTISCNNNDTIIEPITMNSDEEILEPRFTGLIQGYQINEVAEALPNDITIPTNLPTSFDLSLLMPPILNQGEQKSDVAFATAYYLKSYQEKIQHNYEYLSNNEVMSPAFVYNQTKISENCNEGTCIENALFILKSKGVNIWNELSYTQDNCTNLPNETQIELASINKIESYHNVLNNSLGLPLTTILKSLLVEGNPIILGIKIDANFKDAIPKIEDTDNNPDNDIYRYDNCDIVNNDKHAMLIVGYDDDLNAFKVVNSWGENWANQGYAFINYNFFLDDQTDPNYKEGLLELYVAFDVE